MLLSEGQMSDYKGAALMLPAMPRNQEAYRRQRLGRALADAAMPPAAISKPRSCP
jgi:hypothetical protein